MTSGGKGLCQSCRWKGYQHGRSEGHPRNTLMGSDVPPTPLDYIRFDGCVNHGVGAVNSCSALCVAADGAIGPKTLRAVEESSQGRAHRHDLSGHPAPAGLSSTTRSPTATTQALVFTRAGTTGSSRYALECSRRGHDAMPDSGANAHWSCLPLACSVLICCCSGEHEMAWIDKVPVWSAAWSSGLRSG